MMNQRQVLLDWADVPCATYKVYVNLGSTSGPNADKKTGLTASQYTTVPLTPGKNYWFRVKACNGFGCTASEWRKFKVSSSAE